MTKYEVKFLIGHTFAVFVSGANKALSYHASRQQAMDAVKRYEVADKRRSKPNAK